MNDSTKTSDLPLYRESVDWAAFAQAYPAPDRYELGMFRWSGDEMRALQEERFREIMRHGWRSPFYQRLWGDAGIEPGDIKGLDDIGKLPIFTSEDIKADQLAHPPYGSIQSEALAHFPGQPLKLQTSGGTTGRPRPTLFGTVEWEINGLTTARALYVQGARPGDVLQHPGTNGLANNPWAIYKACHDYLGIMPLTTGSGVVTPSRRQLEIAEDFGTTIWASFPEYLTQLARVFRAEFGRDIRDLKTRFIASYLGPDMDDSLRRDLEAMWGCPVYDNYGTHEIGLAGFECQAKDGIHLQEDLHYFEFADVDTGLPVAPGEAGDLIVTNLYRTAGPLIRLNLRDLARVKHSDRCACGGARIRMDKFLGRSDDMVKVRGVNIYPMACLTAVKSDARTTGEWFCLVDRHQHDGVIRDEMVVRVEVRRDAGGIDDLKEILEKRLQADLTLKVEVELVPEGALTEQANLGGEGKARRLLDRRNKGGGLGGRALMGIRTAFDDTGPEVAVSIVTGFLGSGKTTLLNSWLLAPDMADTAVIINEFGDTPLDQYFVDLPEDDMVVLPNGCLCCLVRDDLEEALTRLTSRPREADRPLARIVVEMSGLADPGPVAQLVVDMPTASGRLRLDEIVATVDSEHVGVQLATNPECLRQIAFADRLVFTKADRLDDDSIMSARTQVTALNGHAAQQLGRDGRLEDAPPLPTVADPAAGSRPSPMHEAHAHEAHAHAHGVVTCTLVADEPLDWDRFARWFRRIRREHGEGLLRAKGLLSVAGEDRLVAVDAVHHVGYPPRRMAGTVAEGRSTVVLILQGLDVAVVRADWREVLGA